MPDDYRTQRPSNDAPRDPLDDLIAPILGRNVTPEARNVPTRPETPKQGPRNPLDDLIPDAELRAEASKAATRFAVKDQARWHFLRSTPGRMFVILAIVLVAIGALIGEQFDGRRAWKGWSERLFAEGKRQVDPEAKLPTREERSMALVPAKILTPKELFASASPAVVRVNVYNARSKPIGHGSGFFVRDDSTVVTNFHVIDGANSAEVVLKDGAQLPVRGVEAADEASDIAILKVDHGNKNVIRYLTLGSNELPPVGGRVYVIGSPKGYDYTLSDGIVSGHHERDGRKWIQTTAPVSHGSSGSPVLSDDGSVLGIATWVDWGGQNLNFASPTAAITVLVRSNSKSQALPDLIAEKKFHLVTLRRGRQTEGDKAVARILDGLPKSFHQLSEFWILKGDIQRADLEKGIFDSRKDALAAYRQALLVDDENSDIWQRIGVTHDSLASMHEIHKPDEQAINWHKLEAMKAYEKGTEINPNDERCWECLGRSFLKVKRPQEAAVALRRCLAINPKNQSAHSKLADALAELGDVDGAIAQYKAASDLSSERIDTFGPYDAGLDDYVLGRFLQKHGRHKEAIAAFEKALTLEPKDADVELRKWCEEGLMKSRRIESLKKSN